MESTPPVDKFFNRPSQSCRRGPEKSIKTATSAALSHTGTLTEKAASDSIFMIGCPEDLDSYQQGSRRCDLGDWLGRGRIFEILLSLKGSLKAKDYWTCARCQRMCESRFERVADSKNVCRYGLFQKKKKLGWEMYIFYSQATPAPLQKIIAACTRPGSFLRAFQQSCSFFEKAAAYCVSV